MKRRKPLLTLLLALPAAAHAISASDCLRNTMLPINIRDISFGCGNISSYPSRLPPFDPSPEINVKFNSPDNYQGATNLDSRNTLELSFNNGAYIAARAHSVNGSNFVELEAESGALSRRNVLSSEVVASTRWRDSFRISGGNGNAELKVTVAWPGLAPWPPGTIDGTTSNHVGIYVPEEWHGTFQLSYKQGMTEALDQTGSTTHQGSFSTILDEFRGSQTYDFYVPYDTWIALEGSLTVNAKNTNKSFASGVNITGIELPAEARLETYSGDPLYALAAAPVPEPETWAMLLAGLGIVATTARRKAAGDKLDQA